MKKIYLVEKYYAGDVCRIPIYAFSSRELAERYVDIMYGAQDDDDDYCYYTVREIYLDPKEN